MKLKTCPKCGEPVEAIVTLLGKKKKVPIMCRCRIQAEQVEKERIESIHKDHIRHDCFQNSKLIDNRFSVSGGYNPNTESFLRHFLDDFSEFYAKGEGLILYGDVGTGKTFLGACTANELIDKGYRVLMMTSSRLINEMSSCPFGEIQATIDKINKYDLLVIDDLGAERDTEYIQEQLFNIIDNRYRACLPMLITTNLTINQLKKPKNLKNKRIYDRILEKCTPIEVSGVNIRHEKIKQEHEKRMNRLKGGTE